MQAVVPGSKSGLMLKQSLGKKLLFYARHHYLLILVRRIDKISIRTNPISKVVVTDNWIVMVGAWPWSLQLR